VLLQGHIDGKFAAVARSTAASRASPDYPGISRRMRCHGIFFAMLLPNCDRPLARAMVARNAPIALEPAMV
jgi:hypothetical protein